MPVLPNRGENPTTRGKLASVGKKRGNSKKGKIEGKMEVCEIFHGISKKPFKNMVLFALSVAK